MSAPRHACLALLAVLSAAPAHAMKPCPDWTYVANPDRSSAEGILLYSEASSARSPGKPMVIRATKLTEGPVPPEKFRVPADVKIQGGNQ